MSWPPGMWLGLAQSAGVLHADTAPNPWAALPIWSALPFVLLLAAIATLPLFAPHFWESNRRRAALVAALTAPLMALIAIVAYFSTKPSTREKNRFRFAPIIEVAILFAGIFVTMIAPLLLLNEHGKELGLTQPWQFFWSAGALSSFLDNAPTYLTFASAACGLFGVSVEGTRYLAELLTRGPEAVKILEAISCGAVFMGANTYIGNGPNFMVKAIAEENGVEMPSFFGYMAYSCTILLPLFALVTFLLFRP